MGIYDRDYYQADQLAPIRPWDTQSMVTLLIIVNVACFVANFLTDATGNYLMHLMSLYGTDLVHPLYWPRFVTHGFAHANMMHILFNMLGLYFLGQSVESKYGKWEFFRFYILCIVTCGVVWAAIRMGTGTAANSAVLGASGGVTGVVMLFVFSFPNAILRLYGIIPVKAWMVGVGVIVVNLLGNPNSGVAYDVHLIGAAFAAVYFFGNLNFSSFGNLFSAGKTKFKQTQRGFKVRRAESDARAASADDQESDRILEKIMREGKDSLTRKERAFMQRYSAEVRKRRQQQ